MNQLKTFEGHFNVKGARFALVCSRFNSFIVDALEGGAIDALIRHGAKESDIHVVKAPGAYELPLAVQKVAATGRYDAAATPSFGSRTLRDHYTAILRGDTVGTIVHDV
mgnify:CR=1 FL=1